MRCIDGLLNLWMVCEMGGWLLDEWMVCVMYGLFVEYMDDL